MTAELPSGGDESFEVEYCFLDGDMEKLVNTESEREKEELPHPSTFNCSDSFVKNNPIKDKINLLRKLQMHTCNLYCMRKRKRW